MRTSFKTAGGATCCSTEPAAVADPFKSVALPEVIEEFLDYGVAKCCAFNRRGTLLALDGQKAIDMSGFSSGARDAGMVDGSPGSLPNQPDGSTEATSPETGANRLR